MNLRTRVDRGRAVLAGLGLLLLLPGAGSVFAAAPAAPTGLYGYVNGTTSLVLIWNDNSTDETKWRFTYTIDGGAPGAFEPDSGSTGETGEIGIGLDSSSGITTNTVYTFAVAAMNVGEEVSASTNTITIATKPFDPPSSLGASALANGLVLLTWVDSAYGEDGFFVELRRSGESAFVVLGSMGANGVVAVTPGLDPETQYEFRVRAFQGTGEAPTATTAYSNVATVTTAPLAAPTNLVATPYAASPYTVNFAWADNTKAEYGYEIEYCLEGGSGFTRRHVATASNDEVRSEDVPEWAPGTAYEFRIRAVNGTHVSGYSNVASATTANGFSSPRYASGTVGADFSYQLATQSQSERSGWSVTGLPDGLAFEGSTGVISGKPTAAGVFSVPMTATFAAGSPHDLNLDLRILAPPQIAVPIGPQTIAQGADTTIDLDESFSSPGTSSAVRLATTKGNIDLVLYSATPFTVANFFNYANGGDYEGVLFHRAPLGFVLQGGGYRTYESPDVFERIPTDPPVQNEPGISNRTGTVAMAKIGGNPDSATSEFFVNLGDNSANLDAQNGGFTVFGRVSAPTYASTVAAIAALDRNNYPVWLHTDSGDASFDFTDLPMDQAPAPSAMDQTKLVKIVSVAELPVLTYTLETSKAPAVASFSIAGSELRITGQLPGTAQATVIATDVDGNTTSQTVSVEVRQSFAQWIAGQSVPEGQSGPGDDPDRDMLDNLEECALFGDPSVADHAAHRPGCALAPAGTDRFLEITFPVRKFTELVYVVQGATDLGAGWSQVWSSADGFDAPAVVAAEDLDDRTVVTVRDTVSSAASSRRFLRVTMSEAL